MKKIRRRYVQLIAAVLYNCNIGGFAEGKIYKGGLKGVCVPGLNCYSCPGAVGACPLGSLQSGLLGAKYRFPYYVLGTLLLFGLLFGRFICGFLCPFGLLQELLDKAARALRLPEIKKSRVTGILSYLKYVILALFVILIPLIAAYPAFCKYICPAGTLEGGIPLTAMNEKLSEMCGKLFDIKLLILAAVIAVCLVCFRAFCRFICPLGALYSILNPVSFFGIKTDMKKCINCDKCVRCCRLDIKRPGDHECVSCGECIKDCPAGAVSYGAGKLVRPSER